MKLTLNAEHWDVLGSHLFVGDVEHVAFLYATRGEIVVTDLELMTDEEVVLGLPWHITLSDDVRPRVIKRAWAADAVLIEAHSHRFGGLASFSPTDLDGLAEFAPHVLWRLPNRPYIALVFAPDSFDALVWAAGGAPPMPLDSLVIAGRHWRPTGLTIGAMGEDSGDD